MQRQTKISRFGRLCALASLVSLAAVAPPHHGGSGVAGAAPAHPPPAHAASLPVYILSKPHNFPDKDVPDLLYGVEAQLVNEFGIAPNRVRTDRDSCRDSPCDTVLVNKVSDCKPICMIQVKIVCSVPTVHFFTEVPSESIAMKVTIAQQISTHEDSRAHERR